MVWWGAHFEEGTALVVIVVFVYLLQSPMFFPMKFTIDSVLPLRKLIIEFEYWRRRRRQTSRGPWQAPFLRLRVDGEFGRVEVFLGVLVALVDERYFLG